jgi:hypothetical protein
MASSVAPNRLDTPASSIGAGLPTTAPSIEPTAPTTPPNTLLEWSKTRAEVSGGFTLTTIEPIAVTATNATRYDDALSEVALECTVAPVSGGKTVLGHYPAYTELAEQLGARRFNIPTSVWNKMSEAERWAANTKFLNRMIARGDDVILATRADLAKPGSYFARELEYLLSKGFKISEDGLRLIAPGVR